MAIQITTDQVEAEAQALAEKEKQDALMQIQKCKTEDDQAAEGFRKSLYELQNQTKAIQKQGVAVAEQRAKAEADSILADTEVNIAEIKAQISQISQNQEIQYEILKRELELNREIALKELEIDKSKRLSAIESGKFAKTVNAIGKDTLIDIANAGPEMQAKLLEGLGLQGYIMMDSNNPVNLFNAAEGFVRPGGF